MTYRRRTYPEVLDRLLVAAVDGVAAEEHAWPPGEAEPYTHALLNPPAAQIVSVYAARDGQPHLFRLDVDYALSDDGQSVVWRSGDRPDDGSVVSINYLPEGSRAQLNDLHVGSVLRTLAESIGLEIARLYAELDVVYQSGFVDTASGRALDSLVALLGVERVEGGYPAGELTFRRVAGARGAITIPAGTRVLDESGEVEYATTAAVTMTAAQNEIRVAARDIERNDFVPADTLTVLAVPIAGIASVTNAAPTAINTERESDVALRTRARNFLHGSERATLGAIRQAITRQQIAADVQEHPTTPGLVEYTLHADEITPELEQRVLTAIESVRPAGVRVVAKGFTAPTPVDVRLRLHTRGDALEADLRTAQHTLQTALEGFFRNRAAADDASVNQLIGLALAIDVVEDVELVDVSTAADGSVLDTVAGRLMLAGAPTVLGSLDVADANLPTRLRLTIRFPDSADPPDETSIRQALADDLAFLNTANETLPSGDPLLGVLSFGKWLRSLPLPGRTDERLESLDAVSPLPTAGDVLPYVVTFGFTLESGVTRELTTDADSYTLTPGERLTLDGLTLIPESGGA